MPNYEVWYKKDYSQDTEEALSDFYNCYVPVMRLEAHNLEEVYYLMQGENWSPNGEARQAVQDLGLAHTSMSVGDLVRDLETGEWSIVDYIGFLDVKSPED